MKIRKLVLALLCVGAFSISAQQTAFNGPHNMPGLIEAEDFDSGGEGISYHDGNGGGEVGSAYRSAPDDGPEVEEKPAQSNGHSIGWSQNGDWLEYTFNIEEAGDYIISAMVTSRNDASSKGFKLYIDDVAVSGNIAVTPTKDWFTEWSSDYSTETNITAGEHVLKLEIFAANNAINVDYIEFVSKAAASMDPLSVTKLIRDNAVLQRNENVNFWGTGEPGNSVTIIPEWTTESFITEIDADGKWQVNITTGEAGGPYTLSVSDITKTYNYTNIMHGEVWLCSGQSNMAMPLKGWGEGQEIVNDTEEIANANYPNIRMFSVDRVAAWEPEANYDGYWSICSPSSVPNYSAVAYFFARELHTEINMPIGIIVAAKGNSGAQTWTDLNYLPSVPGFENVIANNASSKLGNGPDSITHLWDDSQEFSTPAALYNGMISPVLDYTMRGATWYQGETNSGSPKQYQSLLPALINSWRNRAQVDTMPFYYVQICPYQNYDNSNTESEELREAQFFTKDLHHTGMAVGLDVGSQWGIHPVKKQEIGQRLAYWALAKDYNKDIVYSGPIYKSLRIVDGETYLSFDEIGGGLKLLNETDNFEIAGVDGTFNSAEVAIVGDELRVKSAEVAHPVQVRYAWSNWVEPNFFNEENLPSSSFTTYDAFVFSEAHVVNHNDMTITVSLAEGETTLTVADLKAQLTTMIGATVTIVDALGNEMVSGNVSTQCTVKTVRENKQGTKVYSIVSDDIAALEQGAKVTTFYPNPVKNTLYLDATLIGEKVCIYGLDGSKILDKNISGASPSLDVAFLEKGVYLLSFSENTTYKLLKE